MSDYLFNDIRAPDLIKNKERSKHFYLRYMLARTQSMFKYEGLPETIPQRELEKLIQINGVAGIIEHRGNLFAVRGGIGGEPNPYFMPTRFIVANPALDNLSKDFTIDKDCVLIPNDSYFTGLLPLMSKYAELLTEVDLSLKCAVINTRFTDLFKGDSDTAKQAADKFIEDVIKGEYHAVADSAFIEGLTVHPLSQNAGSNYLTQLIELAQYYKGSLWNDLGVNSAFNMKREALNAAETNINEDVVKPFADDMLTTRQRAIEKVNAMFGTSITVAFNSAWTENPEKEAQLETQEVAEDEAV